MMTMTMSRAAKIVAAVFALIDLDGDGKISTLEGEAYADLVKSELALKLDNRALTLQVKDAEFPPLALLRTGLGTIHLELSAAPGTMTPREHELLFHNQIREELPTSRSEPLFVSTTHLPMASAI